MTEPPSGQPDDLQPPDADADHAPGDFAAAGYDDRQDSGDASPEESLAHETGRQPGDLGEGDGVASDR